MYTVPHTDITIHGFIASLLQQGDGWDVRCAEADVRDYHQAHYARMDAREALRQELLWWQEFYYCEPLFDLPQRAALASEGIYYLLWQARQCLLPMDEIGRLTTNMAIYLNSDDYLFKQEDTLALFSHNGDPNFDFLIHGFAAQLLTYAASTTIEQVITSLLDCDPEEIVELLLGWLQSPSVIPLRYVQFDIPDVYALYASFVAEQKAYWDADNKKRYQSQQPQQRYFMTHLLQQTREEAANAIELLSSCLSPKQLAAYQRYLSECQQYIVDQITTRKKARSESLQQYWCADVSHYKIQTAVRRLKHAVAQERPAAALAHEVFLLQQQGVMISNIRPLAHFVRVINKVCGSAIKDDSFSKHFRQ